MHQAALLLTVFCNIGSEMSSDDRSWLMQSVLGMDISSTVSYFYPRLIPVVGINSFELVSQINCLGVECIFLQ